MASTNRTGRVSSIDYEAGTYEVTYTDRGKSVTKKINAMSNGEYKMPKIGQIVSVSHNSNGAAAATTTGTVWNKTNKPAEGFKGLYRKEFGSSNGTAYERYDENTGEYKQYSNGTIKRIAGGEIYDEAGGPVTFSGKGQVQVISREGAIIVQGSTEVGIISVQAINMQAGTIINLEAGGAVSVSAGGDISLMVGGCSVVVGVDGTVKITGGSKIELDAPEVAITGDTINITGADGDAVIKGKSLVTHTHTDSIGGSTSGPN